MRSIDPGFLVALDQVAGLTTITEPERLLDYSRDESGCGEFPPQVLCLPASTSAVAGTLALASRFQVPVTPCGARTGKSGGSLPIRGGVALSLERMDRLKRLSPEDLTCVCEPGLVTGKLMEAVEAVGLFYPPDPASLDTCTIGGNIAENAGGPRALKYGVTRDYVLGLEVVLASGEALRLGRRTIKGVAGYDLVSLFVGSEGTLGVVTEATLQLVPRPREVVTALVTFASLRGAASAVTAILTGGLLPRTLELMDDAAIRAVDGKGFHFPAGAVAAILLEFDGDQADGPFEELARAVGLATPHGLVDSLVARNEAQRRGLWEARRRVSTALKTLKPFKFSDDIVVPRSNLVEMVETLKALGRRHGILVATYGHAGDGNLHANFLYVTPEERARAKAAMDEAVRATLALGGTITGEHGVGMAKKDYLPLEQPEPLLALQRELKRLFDPAGILNPGKVL